MNIVTLTAKTFWLFFAIKLLVSSGKLLTVLAHSKEFDPKKIPPLFKINFLFIKI